MTTLGYLIPVTNEDTMRTDWYKPVMAAAGAPLRPETFNFAIRKGGPFYMPLDPVEYIRSLLPTVTDSDMAYLNEHGLGLGAAYREAMGSDVEVHGIPAGAWFGNREVVLTVTGPSSVVSHLEAQVIWLQFRIQVATLAKLAPERLSARLGTVTCEREAEIVRETLDQADTHCDFEIRVDEEGYFNHIHDRAKELIEIVGDPARLFEAGMRAASCIEQHRISVRAAAEAGFLATSNVEIARELGIIAGGTTGHEHTQRHFGDKAAFTAVRDRVAGEVTFLLDTYSTRSCGMPSAIDVMRQTPDRVCSIRFDTESTMEGDYLLGVYALREAGLSAPINLGGGFNADFTRRFEELRRFVDWPAHLQRYMYGQYLVEPHVPLPTRGDVGAVYKVCQSGDRATMKFSDDPAKSSAPGHPVTWRLVSPGRADRGNRPIGITGQLGEEPAADYNVLTDGRTMHTSPDMLRIVAPVLSEATQALVDELTEHRRTQIASVGRSHF
jgi:nicotinate phosphoribosyltransferase